MRKVALIAVLAASSTAFASVATDAERAQAGARLAESAQRALDGVLGPGHAQVRVDVQGESSEIESESETILPIVQHGSAAPAPVSADAAARLIDLPGYVKGGTSRSPSGTDAAKPPPASGPSASPVATQKDSEHSLHDAGFRIRSISATVILDSALNDVAVRDVSQLLPQVLKLDTTRGDVMTLLRAPLRPAWKSAFATPGDWRTAVYAAGGGLVALLAVLIAGACLIGAGRALGRALGRELAARSGAEPPGAASAPELLPELSPGAGGLLEAGAASGNEPSGGTPLLGRRFDFLGGQDPDLIGRALAVEKAEDLSLFFGHLADNIPDMASRLFARLPAGVQAQVSQAMLKLSLADPERLGAMEERLRSAVENGMVGPQSLGRILSRVPGDARADLLGRLAASDARAAEEVERNVFSFEDLASVGIAPLRRLLGAVPYEIWGPALRGAPSGLADQVLSDLPEGPRELVRSTAATPQPREKIDEARSRILDALSAMVAKGEVALERAEKDGDLV
jgi:hypothetical protein